MPWRPTASLLDLRVLALPFSLGRRGEEELSNEADELQHRLHGDHFLCEHVLPSNVALCLLSKRFALKLPHAEVVASAVQEFSQGLFPDMGLG